MINISENNTKNGIWFCKMKLLIEMYVLKVVKEKIDMSCAHIILTLGIIFILPNYNQNNSHWQIDSFCESNREVNYLLKNYSK